MIAVYEIGPMPGDRSPAASCPAWPGRESRLPIVPRCGTDSRPSPCPCRRPSHYWCCSLGAVIVIAGRGGSDSGGPLPSGGSSPSANLIDWKLFGRVPERIHYLRSDINPPLKQVWDYNDQALIEFPPAIADGRLFIVNKYSNVRALDAETGKVVWDLRRDKHYKGPPTDVTAPVVRGRGGVRRLPGRHPGVAEREGRARSSGSARFRAGSSPRRW